MGTSRPRQEGSTAGRPEGQGRKAGRQKDEGRNTATCSAFPGRGVGVVPLCAFRTSALRPFCLAAVAFLPSCLSAFLPFAEPRGNRLAQARGVSRRMAADVVVEVAVDRPAGPRAF